MADYPALPMWTDAFVADTTHLDAEQVGVYILLLFTAWRRPKCDLPDDDAFLANVARCDIRTWRRRHRAVMEPFHTIEGGRWIQKRLHKERNHVADLSEKMRAISNRRWHKNNDLADANASTTDMPTECTQTHTQKEPERKNQTRARDFVVGAAPVGGRSVGRGRQGNGHTTIADPHVRLGKFMNKLATQLGGESGWAIIIAATDAQDMGHAQALLLCQRAAKAIGKGWPRSWPTDGSYFAGGANVQR